MTKSELERCIYEHGKDIYAFCRYLTCNKQEADDLYQDTFLKAIELAEKIEFQNNPKSYLLSIALRIWKNRKRKYAWRKRITGGSTEIDMQEMEQVKSLEPSPEEYMLGKAETEAVRAAVKKLPERLEMVVLLFYMEEQSIEEIAFTLKIPVGTVKSRLHQARKVLEKELEDVLDEKRHR